ncbi:hypothetical protein CHLNCDRAFT_137004 [Chlorella variabilis]|uniref:Coenzyme Q-binding protein COQ10 START domain-containing protein n=1 Tax=Chlorella variabilis TaxID=554065 RepID=E1ZLS6_CHLVA|nr:hypothetical protein CHLNCDRAFT_137004 [Chlorella variabilis]EFN53317.1 hypothetical protein CHLNCDRAFT_137004 [Chlorella variabilis]|eukprot:XP_005845419.1 hypothetical protein CHLNCDRAFT_137004 [Chlorella variabilis]
MARAKGSQSATAPAEDDVTISTFSESSKDMHVRVEKPAAGYLCTLSMFARVPLPPDQLFELLVSPDDCKRIFKSLKNVHHRRVLADDGHGNRTVEVDQTGSWRFLMFRGSFTVRMIVEQRRADRMIHFRLARSGFMRDFSGTWVVRPFGNTSLDQLVNRHNPTPLHRLQASRGRHKARRGGASGLRAVEQTLGLAGQQQESLVQLQQSIAPALAPPAAVTRLLQRIAAKQITKIMTDLQVEARRINSSSGSSSGGLLEAPEAAEQQGPAAGAKKGKKQQRQEQQQAADGRLDKKQLAAHVSDLR